MLFFLFGLPGAGKNYVGELLAQEFGFYFYDADLELTPEMRAAIQKKEEYTEEMRDYYYQKLIDSVKVLQKQHAKLVIAQGLFKNKHRRWFQAAFPELQFFWIQADDAVRESRLTNRSSILPISPEYAFKIKKIFEEPDLPHTVIINNTDRSVLKGKLTLLLEGR